MINNYLEIISDYLGLSPHQLPIMIMYKIGLTRL
jgi:hypothetical protein